MMGKGRSNKGLGCYEILVKEVREGEKRTEGRKGRQEEGRGGKGEGRGGEGKPRGCDDFEERIRNAS